MTARYTETQQLRAAARLMRERAEDASILDPGPWLVEVEGDPEVPWVKSAKGKVIAPGYLMQAQHIASWHPGVALAVADWLDNEAAATELVASEGPTLGLPTAAAVQLARIYLGTPAPGEGDQ